MIHNNVILRAKRSEDIEEISSLLTAQAKVSLTEEGCERFEVYQSEADAQTFILVEWWATQEDLDRHKTAKQFVEVYVPKSHPFGRTIPPPKHTPNLEIHPPNGIALTFLGHYAAF